MKRLIFILVYVAVLMAPSIAEGQNQITRPKKKTEQKSRKNPNKQSMTETQPSAPEKLMNLIATSK